MAKDYVRLLKYADSPYKCKMLKKAALGRMCTAVKKLQKCLVYLEEVRRHLGRLPQINPFSQTLLLAGFPNVGKSTFMNQLSRANVEIADWAFTTRAPHVGHFDFNYQRWQIVDTPGVLDRPLTARNTIELTAITALAHLFAAVLFLVDISGTCGYTVQDQVALFHSLAPLLQKKPVVIVLNKADVRNPDSMDEAEKAAVQSMLTDREADLTRFVTCSTEKGLNLEVAKTMACEMLQSVQQQMRAKNNHLDVLYVAEVTPTPDRPPFIPRDASSGTGDLPATKDKDAFHTSARDAAIALGGPGVYSADDRESWILAQDEWRYDVIPELFDGKKIADFVDPDIEAKLEALQREEDELEAQWDTTKHAPTAAWRAAQNALAVISTERESRRRFAPLHSKRKSPRKVSR